MKFVAYSREVFKTFIGDFKALIASLEQLDGGEGYILRDKMMDATFIFNMLLLSDVFQILAIASKKVQISSCLPWEYVNGINNLFDTIKRAIYELEQLINALTEDMPVPSDILDALSGDLFPQLKSSREIFTCHTYQRIPVPDRAVGLVRVHRSNNDDPLITKFQKCMNDAGKYINALHETLDSRL